MIHTVSKRSSLFGFFTRRATYSQAVDVFVEMAFADLCDRTVEGSSAASSTFGGGGGGGHERMDDTAAMAMTAGGFSSASTGGGGGGASSKCPGRGSRIFAQRDPDAGALRLARFEGALARIAWDHYAGLEEAAADGVPVVGSLVGATTPGRAEDLPPRAQEPPPHGDDDLRRAALRTGGVHLPSSTLSSRLDAFMTVFFMPNLRRVAGK